VLLKDIISIYCCVPCDVIMRMER